MKSQVMKALLLGLISVSLSFGYSAEQNQWLSYEAVPNVRGMDLPLKKRLREKDFAFYSAIQYGSKASEVLYLVYDCEKKLSPHNVVFVYKKGDPKYGKPVKMIGRKRKDYYHFSPIRLKSKYGSVTAEYQIRLQVRSLWDKVKVDAEVDIRCQLKKASKAVKSSFVLKGDLKCEPNAAVDLEPIRLIQAPKLKGRWDHRSDPPHVRGKIYMGKLGLIPGSGISDKASLVISKKEDPKSKMKKRFRIMITSKSAEFKYNPWKRLHDKRVYKMELTLDLAPFFGKLKATDDMVLR